MVSLVSDGNCVIRFRVAKRDGSFATRCKMATSSNRSVLLRIKLGTGIPELSVIGRVVKIAVCIDRNIDLDFKCLEAQSDLRPGLKVSPVWQGHATR